MLRARLYERLLQKREAAAQALNDAKTDIGWGHQIRSYVLQPYQMVKDLPRQDYRAAISKLLFQSITNQRCYSGNERLVFLAKDILFFAR